MTATERVLLALAACCATAAFGYAALRCVEVAAFVQTNPTAVIGAAHSPFLWRCGVAAYLGGAGAFGGYALAGRAPDAAARWIPRAAIAAALAIAAQAALCP